MNPYASILLFTLSARLCRVESKNILTTLF